jgi:mRNA interferase RelE/StbE
MSEIVLHRRALRYLQRLSRPDQERVRLALTRLAEDTTAYPGVVQMAGEWIGYQRIRIGDLRVIFWYDPEEDIIYVDHIGPRGDVYKP